MRTSSSLGLPVWLAAVLLGGTLVQAEQKRDRPASVSDQPREGARWVEPIPPGMARLAQMLNPEQRRHFREILQDQRGKMTEIEQRLRELQRQGIKLALSPHPEEDRLHRLSMEVGELETHRAMLRVKVLAKINGLLTPDQRERVCERIEDFMAMPQFQAPAVAPWAARPGWMTPRGRAGIGSPLRPQRVGPGRGRGQAGPPWLDRPEAREREPKVQNAERPAKDLPSARDQLRPVKKPERRDHEVESNERPERKSKVVPEPRREERQDEHREGSDR